MTVLGMINTIATKYFNRVLVKHVHNRTGKIIKWTWENWKKHQQRWGGTVDGIYNLSVRYGGQMYGDAIEDISHLNQGDRNEPR